MHAEGTTVLTARRASARRDAGKGRGVNPRSVGSDLDQLLRKDGLPDEGTAVAVTRVIAMEIESAMAAGKISRSEMARRMRTSRSTVDRLLDPANPSVTLRTLEKAASAVGRRLEVRLEESP